jgi:hypothetical protein
LSEVAQFFEELDAVAFRTWRELLSIDGEEEGSYRGAAVEDQHSVRSQPVL